MVLWFCETKCIPETRDKRKGAKTVFQTKAIIRLPVVISKFETLPKKASLSVNIF